MNPVLRAISTLTLLLLLAACGASNASTKSTAVPADRPMKESMATCIGMWMEEVNGTSVAKTLGDPGQMSRIQLEQCGNQRIRSRGIAAGFACTPEGCFASDKHGFKWTEAAQEWACENSRPDVCDE